MVYNLTVNATYNKNCEYRESTVQETLPIINELQQVTLSVLDTDITPSVVIGEEYTLRVKCVLMNSGIPVKKGYVTINDFPTKCYLNNDGRAEIKYTPLEVGEETITIKYNDTQSFFQPTQITTTINVTKIETRTEIIEYPKMIADYKESVTIKAKVTRADNDNDVTYGRVTFLHYLEYNVNSTTDRIEKIIGNPVYLNQNGEATITYVPMQHYSDDIDLENNEYNDNYVEYIKAVYNYEKNSTNDNDNENVQWHYYGKSDDFGCIYLKRPNSIQIKGYYQENNILKELDIDDYKRYTTKDNIILKVYIKDEKGEDMLFTNQDEITLFIKRTKTDENNKPIDITLDDESVTAVYNNGCFNASINVEPGFYDIYATSDIQHTSNNKYLQSIDESMHYYFQVKYETTNNIPLELLLPKNNVNLGETMQITVRTAINNLLPEEKIILMNASCHLNISDEPVKFVSHGSFLEANFNITFDSIKDYNVYGYTDRIAYIHMVPPNKYNRIIPASYTSSAIVYVSGQITPSIDTQVIKSVYPGKIQYTASLSGIKTDSKEGEVLIKYNDTNKSSATYIFDRFVNQYTETLPELDAGEYQIFFNVDSKEEHTSTMEIEQATIIPSITQSTVQGTPNTQQFINLSSNGETINIDPNDISIQTKRKDEDNTKYQERPIVGANLGAYGNILTISFLIQTYTEDTWDVIVNIKNNNNYKTIAESSSSTYEFTTVLHPLTIEEDDITITEDNNNNIDIHIKNPQIEYIPLIVELSEHNNLSNKLKYICVTDVSGNVSIPAFGDKILWNNRNLITVSINPTHEQLINAILADEATYESLQYDDTIDGVFYGKKFFEEDTEENSIDNPDDDDFDDDDTNIDDNNLNNVVINDETNDSSISSENENNTIDDTNADNTTNTLTKEEIIFAGLLDQLTNNESKYLFTYYKESTTNPIYRGNS